MVARFTRSAFVCEEVPLVIKFPLCNLGKSPSRWLQPCSYGKERRELNVEALGRPEKGRTSIDFARTSQSRWSSNSQGSQPNTVQSTVTRKSLESTRDSSPMGAITSRTQQFSWKCACTAKRRSWTRSGQTFPSGHASW